MQVLHQSLYSHKKRPQLRSFFSCNLIISYVNYNVEVIPIKKIRTNFLLVANKYEKKLQKLYNNYKKTHKVKYINDMYEDLLNLAILIYNNNNNNNVYRYDIKEARNYITHEVTSEIINKLKTNPDYKIHVWYKGVRFLMLHWRDNYIRYYKSSVFETNNSLNLTAMHWGVEERPDSFLYPKKITDFELLESKSSLINGALNKAVSDLGYILNLKKKTAYYYKYMIKSNHSNIPHCRYIKKQFKFRLQEELYG